MKNKLLSLLLLTLVSYSCSAQINYQFVKHLYTNNLVAEHTYYLHSLHSSAVVNSDSLHYMYAKLYLQQQNDSLFFAHYTQCSALFNADSNALRYSHYYFLRHKKTKVQQRWFTQNFPASNDKLSSQVVSFYSSLVSTQPTIVSADNPLFTDIKKYNKLKRKSPAVAACLSAVVPGLGKWYGQRPNSAIITFFSQGVYAYQTIESVKKLGLKNGFSIFSLSFFSFFYLSNIYGSYHDLKDLKQQRKKQLLLDEEKYYQLNYPATLY